MQSQCKLQITGLLLLSAIGSKLSLPGRAELQRLGREGCVGSCVWSSFALGAVAVVVTVYASVRLSEEAALKLYAVCGAAKSRAK